MSLVGCAAAGSPSAIDTPTASPSPTPTIPADAAPTELQGHWSTTLGPGDKAELIIGQTGYSIQRGGASGHGHLSVHGDQIEFSLVSNCAETGTYRWAIKDDVLTFDPVGARDPCPRAYVLKQHDFRRLAS